MKFVFADSIDQISADYDFLTDSFPPGRRPYWDDVFPHEFFNTPPYDGMLVSRGIVGDEHSRGKYSIAQSMRFRRVGAREFLRYPENKFPGSLVFGDNGAFSYVKEEVPPITVDETLEFYADGGFTHGCSTDHVILNYHDDLLGDVTPTGNVKLRYDITLENAHEFIKKAPALGSNFTPLGVIQGWSPQSMAKATSELLKMGYKYLAVGGLVPLKSPQIHTVLKHIQEELLAYPGSCLHLLGFAKADNIGEFVDYPIASFDSTSPLIRAFKDSSRNYYLLENGEMHYYSSVRIPQALENTRLKRLVNTGQVDLEFIIKSEREALDAVRAVAARELKVNEAIDSIVEYNRLLLMDLSKEKQQIKLDMMRQRYTDTLLARPWEKCDCEVCLNAGVDVIIFRASNLNKRRGFHNLSVYKKQVSTFQ
jgi:hypothetical protein